MSDIKIQNVTNVIGDAYKSWKPGEMVIIPSYVGSGKTHFILNELAKLADEKNKIVYLCNRKALLDQVIEKNGEKIVPELKDDSQEDCYIYNENVYILSYQYCEAVNMFPNIEIPKAKLYPNLEVSDDEKVKISVKDVRYFVYEEAQYFATDIAFNEKCSFWGKRKLVYENSTSIFMTATPEPLYCFLALRESNKLVNDIVFDMVEVEKSLTDVSKKMSNVKSGYSDYQNRQYTTSDSCKEITDNPNVTKASRINTGNISVRVPGLFGEMKYEINESVEKTPSEFYPYMIERYKDIKDLIKVYSVVVDHISRIIEQYKNEYKKYDISRNYDKYTCNYFEEYENLYESIVDSPDRWLIFVDTEIDGLKLEGAINALCKYAYDSTSSKYKTNYYSPYAAFLSRETIKKKRSVAYQEYKNIIEKEIFSCKVLIATKLLDCGVNIDVKSNVNNIVISQLSKTEFIQMLGRVRTIDHNSEISEENPKPVTLYIRNIGAQTINGESSQRIKDLLWVKSLVLNQARQMKSKDPDSYDFSRFYAAIEDKTITPAIKRNINFLNKVGEDLEVEPAYFAYCLYDIYQYYSAITDRATGDPKLSYLKRQLSWIGKNYSVENWIGYTDNIKKICKLLSEHAGKEASCKNADLLALKATIVSILLKLPKTIMPEVFTKRIKKLQKALREYKNSLLAESSDKKSRQTIIKNVTLNDIFKGLNIPYEILTEKTKSKNWWKVNNVEITTDDE